MKVLVVGGGGQVARAVLDCAPPTYQVIVKSRQELDITDEAALLTVIESNAVNWIVNGAAYTAVDRAESDAAEAKSVNETAVRTMASAAARSGCRLLHLSTDFVFDGSSNRAYRPSDPANPLSVYGSTKLGGERAVWECHAEAIIVRTAWVYAAAGRNFVLTMLRLMREKPEVRVVADQFGTPTWATGTAEALWGLIGAAAAPGTYHWTDLGVATWYDFAVAIQEEGLVRGMLANAVPIVPISTAAYPTPARRPVFSVLDSQSTRDVLKIAGTHWRQNLRMMLDELRTA